LIEDLRSKVAGTIQAQFDGGVCIGFAGM